MSGRLGLAGVTRPLDMAAKIVVVLFMLGPAALILVLSFSGESSLRFPPRTWGFTQYESFLASDYWLASVGKSTMIALCAPLLAALVGVPACVALERSRMPLRGTVRLLGVAPLVLPGVAYALALYTFFVEADLAGTVLGLILADSMLALPFVVVIVSAGLRQIPRELELVAMTLGASAARATFGITLRLLVPSIAAALLLGFVTTFDEAVFVNFLGGGGVVTLPKAIFDSVRTDLEPLITAIAALLMVATGIVVFLATRWRRNAGEAAWSSSRSK